MTLGTSSYHDHGCNFIFIVDYLVQINFSLIVDSIRVGTVPGFLCLEPAQSLVYIIHRRCLVNMFVE